MASESSACETSAHSAIECVKDNESSSPDVDVLRANITDERHACSWVEDYGLKTNTSWVVDFVKPTAKCERMVFHKVWRCKEAKREKSCGEAAAHCPAKIDLKIKVNRNTKRNDAFLRGEKPLPAVIKLFHHKNHSHSTAAADALSRLTPTMQTRETFLAYFDSGMSPAEATRLHESKLLVQEDGYALVANSAVNPLPPAIYYWHRLCREKNFGKDVGPLLKIAEMPLYAKHDNSLEALIEQLRRVYAEEKSNAAYTRHLLSGTKRLRRLQEQKRGVGAMMAMDAALGLELRRGRYIKVQPTAISRRRPGLTRGSKRVAAGRPASGPSPKRAKKRRHVLQQSVSQNIPHVKLHGYGH
ncbi:hypothetical protein MRX96_049592 [Rhipicephalus microplus]